MPTSDRTVDLEFLFAGATNLSVHHHRILLERDIMTMTTDLIAALVKAANTIARVDIHERRRLLESAISSVKALADLMTKSGLRVSLDRASLRARTNIAGNLARFSDATISRSMLALAHELRILRVRHRSFMTTRISLATTR